MADGEHMAMVVRHHDVHRPARREAAPADAGRDLDDLAGHTVELRAQRLSLGASWDVAENRLIAGSGHAEDPVAHADLPERYSLKLTSGSDSLPPRRSRRGRGRAPHTRQRQSPPRCPAM